MKARSKELLDRAIAATIAAIEIYNKPDFRYREEAFAVLAINGWELPLKAKWLASHGNELGALYVYEASKSKTATTGSKLGRRFGMGARRYAFRGFCFIANFSPMGYFLHKAFLTASTIAVPLAALSVSSTSAPSAS